MESKVIAAVLALSICACAREDPPIVGSEVALQDLDDVMEAVYCDRLEECGCTGTLASPSQEECRQWAHDLKKNVDLRVDFVDGTYDPVCAATILNAHLEHGCGPYPGPYTRPEPRELAGSPECVAPCAPIYGTVDLGEECIRIDALSSNCKPGLYCDNVGCREWCADPPPPLTELGEPCMGHAECATGYCPAGSCATPNASGAACEQAAECKPGLECVNDVCTPVPALDEPCDDNCLEGLICEGSFCRPDRAAICTTPAPFLQED